MQKHHLIWVYKYLPALVLRKLAINALLPIQFDQQLVLAKLPATHTQANPKYYLGKNLNRISAFREPEFENCDISAGNGRRAFFNAQNYNLFCSYAKASQRIYPSKAAHTTTQGNIITFFYW